MKFLSAEEAAALDEHLMSESSGWQLAQLMELAGLSVASCCHALLQSSSAATSAAARDADVSNAGSTEQQQQQQQSNVRKQEKKKVLVICGPGNNGGDGLVAARHLLFFGHDPVVWYPKPKAGIYASLVKQLSLLRIPVLGADVSAAEVRLDDYDYVIDAIFGFSFTGTPREPFASIVTALAATKVAVLAVDVPSSWNISSGPPGDGDIGGRYMPTALISLSAPKACSKHFTGRHFLGGRFLPDEFMRQHGLPPYPGSQQFVELPNPLSGDESSSKAAL